MKNTLPDNAIEQIKDYLLQLQANLYETVNLLDPQVQCVKDSWTRSAGGGGLTCAFHGGKIFAKAGINFSHVSGEKLPPSASAHRPELEGRQYSALGISLVIHPENPYVPTAHANLRFFIAEKENHPAVWWFGGGFDLTPYYGFREDCQHWHQTALAACKPFGDDLYPRFKAWADQYFYLKHRDEARGIGGLFFDDFNEGGVDNSFAFMKSVGDHFIKAYKPIIKKRHEQAYGSREKAFQLYRRGRYVEFNLVFDRGTLFGLQSGGRTESILISLPPEVHWQYNWHPEEGSAEESLYKDFLRVQNWV